MLTVRWPAAGRDEWPSQFGRLVRDRREYLKKGRPCGNVEGRLVHPVVDWAKGRTAGHDSRSPWLRT